MKEASSKIRVLQTTLRESCAFKGSRAWNQLRFARSPLSKNSFLDVFLYQANKKRPIEMGLKSSLVNAAEKCAVQGIGNPGIFCVSSLLSETNKIESDRK
jgi:hypothetical protein